MVQITKDVIVPAVAEYTKQVKSYKCDVCGKERQHVATCVLCGRHCCTGTFERCHEYDPNEYGDYPGVYCKFCYKLKYEKYKEDYRMVELDYELALDRLEQKVRKESLEMEVKNETTT